MASWQGAFLALRTGKIGEALRRVFDWVRNLLFGPSFYELKMALSGGPLGHSGQYGGTYSRVRSKTLSPTWNQWLEMRVEGGELDASSGEYDNRSAPYTSLRIEVWDRDRLSRDDFIGEVSVRLCPLMDGRVHAYELPLADPEGMCMADGGVTGSLRFELHYES